MQGVMLQKRTWKGVDDACQMALQQSHRPVRNFLHLMVGHAPWALS
jgi:hypothetical protein